jgi:hypothetical protein
MTYRNQEQSYLSISILMMFLLLMYSPLQQATGHLIVNTPFVGGFTGSAGSATSNSATSSSATSSSATSNSATSSSATSGAATTSSTMNCTVSGACFVGSATSGSATSGNPAFSLRYAANFEGLVGGVPRWNVTVWIQGSPQQLSQIKYVIYHSITLPYNPTSKSYEFSAGKRTDLKPITSRENNFLFQKTVSVGRFPLSATLYFKNGTNTEMGPIQFYFYTRK